MRRNRAPGAGNHRELAVMKVLAEEGWLCASRRHIGGAGDILAVRCNEDKILSRRDEWMWITARLIEVKSTTRSPWVTFGPADRQALVETAEKCGAEPLLAWWPPRGKLRWIRASEFPLDRRITSSAVNPQGVVEA